MNESVESPKNPELDVPVVVSDSKPQKTQDAHTELSESVVAYTQSTAWDQPTKRTAVVVMLVVGGLIFWMSRPVLTVLILAFMISYLLSPIVDLLERIRVPRGLSTVVLYLLLLVVLILAPILIVPILVNQLSDLIVVDVPRTTQGLVLSLQTWVNNLPMEIEILGFDINIEGIVQQAQDTISGDVAFQILPSARDLLEYFNRLISTATNVVGGTALLGITLVGGIFNIFLFLLFLFFLSLYMTKDAPRIRNYIQGLFPESYHSEAAALLREMGQIWQAFFRGQLILAIVIGVVTGGILALLGMPGALILGIIAGALEVIPNIGPVLAMIPAVIVALIQGSNVLDIGNIQFALLVVGVYFVIQQLENQLLVPRIIGTSVNLHPIVVLCGVVVGASVAGILGAFLAAPIVATLRVVGSYVHAKLLDYPPFFVTRAARAERRPYVYRRVVIPDQEVEEISEEDASDTVTKASGKFGSTAAR
ncbi:MAG: AI-2E family transporter [Caldilineaceae bacterium]|nr:AI-2E family transporter [Caldilineaceae bacterium]